MREPAQNNGNQSSTDQNKVNQMVPECDGHHKPLQARGRTDGAWVPKGDGEGGQ